MLILIGGLLIWKDKVKIKKYQQFIKKLDKLTNKLLYTIGNVLLLAFRFLKKTIKNLTIKNIVGFTKKHYPAIFLTIGVLTFVSSVIYYLSIPKAPGLKKTKEGD